ncbi:hypothetical protein B5C34_01170 [Pacificimonas flava]|uniref:DUF2306 domain-containing protein n=2 Tax=Pacificimonas TaxID=1960290 RepID=A0A219B1H5_9SPHN|nr:MULTISPECIES: DUF2306 domain-containing protein [Pacificimonas]MBZ6378174.1 DUF2306 domain-containing protein [Pacificimonas aurantium]OWV32197.1 hypothetical protein B5C34_01170 [Pacificimonas flava]
MTALSLPFLPGRTGAPRTARRLTLVQTGILICGSLLTLLIAAAILRGSTGSAPFSLWQLPPAVIVHLLTLQVAAPLGTYVFVARKGTPRHRLAGRIWCAFMLATALSAYFIRTSPDGSMSLIHLFIPGTILSIAAGIWLARRHRVKAHERMFLQLYVGALLVAGFFAYQGDRTMAVLTFG